MTNSFCVIPWVHLSIRNNGDLRVCCQSHHGPQKGVLKDSQNNNLNAANSDLEEARNAPLLKDIRSLMLQGQWPEECIRCKTEEQSGILSRRTYETEAWKDRFTFEDANKVTSTDGSLLPQSSPLNYLDLRFGNLCNLRCRSCNPTESSSWYKEHYKIWGNTYQDNGKSIELIQKNLNTFTPSPDPYTWYQNPQFWQQLEQKIPDLNYIHCEGGEPLLIQQHYNFLEKCILAGQAQEIDIEYTSNITTIPPRAWELWKHFKSVRLGASIDGVGLLNDYIRYPSQWSQIKKNLHRLDQAEGPFILWLSMTVMALNINKLPEIIIWKIKQNFKRFNNYRDQPFLSFHPLHSPQFLSPQVLPFAVKQKVQEKFATHIPLIDEAIQQMPSTSNVDKTHLKEKARQVLDQYSQFMLSRSLDEKILDKFFHQTTSLDKLRGCSLKEANPELFSWIEPTYLHWAQRRPIE